MKTTSQKTKHFDAVKTFREIKEKISEEIYGMTPEEITAYFNREKGETKAERDSDSKPVK